ncbi:MAG TPA: hypothetical protein VGF01_17275 [Terracidiphilus sp.]|jgi:hypothetical protein
MIQTEMQQDLGRARNVLQNYLIRKLLIPKVYLDVDWNGLFIDVLAIDRAGSGDVHAVRIARYSETDDIGEAVLANVLGVLSSSKQVDDSVVESMSFQSHFRYVAVVNEYPDAHKFKPTEITIKQALAADGVGRIGILYVDLTEDDPSVQVILRAERFRNSKELVEMTDQFVATHTPNWEVRE